MLIEDLRPGDLRGPDEQRAAAGSLEGCGFQVLDRSRHETDERLDIAAAGRDALGAAGADSPRNGRHRPLHDISCVRQRQPRLHATAGMTAHGKRFAQLRADIIAPAWSSTSAHNTEHLRGVSTP